MDILERPALFLREMEKEWIWGRKEAEGRELWSGCIENKIFFKKETIGSILETRNQVIRKSLLL